jgi:hypothetical protein
VTDREITLIAVGGPTDRTATADATLRPRKRNRERDAFGFDDEDYMVS